MDLDGARANLREQQHREGQSLMTLPHSEVPAFCNPVADMDMRVHQSELATDSADQCKGHPEMQKYNRREEKPTCAPLLGQASHERLQVLAIPSIQQPIRLI